MIKLNTEHIELIRKYFLSNSEEEQLNIQTRIQPAYLSILISQLKEIFIDNSSNDAELIAFTNRLEAIDIYKDLQEIRQDYYVHLAVLYNSGRSNTDIEALLKSNNTHFSNEISFQKELKDAFRLNERMTYKNKFREIETEDALAEEEINLAFKLKERKGLKEQFRNLEHKSKPFIKPDVVIVPFSWKKLAIAATISGVLLTTIIYIFDKNKSQNQIDSISKLEKNKIKPGNSFDILLQTALSDSVLKYEENEENVIKETSLGYTGNQEKVTKRVFKLETMISELDSMILRALQIKPSSDPTIKSLKQKSDSIKQLTNKYTFYDNILSVYLLSSKPIHIYKIGSLYYIMIDGKVFECKKTKTLLPLNITNKETASKITDIIY